MDGVLLGAGPHGSFILMCACGAIEVTRAPQAWRRFTLRFDRMRCHCLTCGKTRDLSTAPGSEGSIAELIAARKSR